MRPIIIVLCFITSVFATTMSPADETLSALADREAPDSLTEMWAGFDPTAEPLEVEILKEWEEDGVVLRVLRFRVGVFHGETARVAGIYGFPKGETHLPGLLQIHGGGQYADYKACLTNAKRGYATFSLAWGGRISSPEYRVNSDVVKLFWEQRTDHPDYKLTTDWGAVDGYHAPSRHRETQFPSARAYPWTIDAVESPRNSGWFLGAMAARRALTFLESQPEVDPARLGVYGHSMGGKLTVLTSVDPRVKAAAPSCGGISDRDNSSALFVQTLGDHNSLQRISCPIIFLSPANDFHGRIGDLPKAIEEIQGEDWRVTCAPHHNHQDTAPYEVATQLWFDEHLRGTFEFPETPQTTLTLRTDTGIPSLFVQADRSKEILEVDVFYTSQGKPNEQAGDREDVKTRFWHHAEAVPTGPGWTAALPLSTIERPLWVYANVRYKLNAPVRGAGYYYRDYEAKSFNVSSLLQQISPDQLRQADVRPPLQPTLLIESFEDGWQKEWFSYRPEEWPRVTHKLNDPQWRAPEGAKLGLQVRSQKPNKLLVVIDEHVATVELDGSSEWQEVVLDRSDFRSYRDEPLASWQGVRSLKLTDTERLRPGRGEAGESRKFGSPWQGDAPEFRTLRWIAR